MLPTPYWIMFALLFVISTPVSAAPITYDTREAWGVAVGPHRTFTSPDIFEIDQTWATVRAVYGDFEFMGETERFFAYDSGVQWFQASNGVSFGMGRQTAFSFDIDAAPEELPGHPPFLSETTIALVDYASGVAFLERRFMLSGFFGAIFDSPFDGRVNISIDCPTCEMNFYSITVRNFATQSAQITPVSVLEPPTILLMGLSMAGLVLARRWGY